MDLYVISLRDGYYNLGPTDHASGVYQEPYGNLIWIVATDKSEMLRLESKFKAFQNWPLTPTIHAQTILREHWGVREAYHRYNAQKASYLKLWSSHNSSFKPIELG